MNNINLVKASLNLHGSVPVRDSKVYNKNLKLIKYGYIAPKNISKTVERVLISEATKLNKTFYTTWSDVTSKTREELAVDQICHYISVTFGDILNLPEIVYIPNVNCEKDMSVPLRFVKGCEVDEIKDLTRNLLYKKVALKADTIADVFNILQTHEVDITKVRNRDSRTYIHVKHDIAPRDPIDILRCAVYDATGELSLIKNKDTYKKIEEGTHSIRWLKDNEQCLAVIFNRYKPIFMSMKTHAEAKPYINRISKLSKKHHSPMQSATHEPTTGYEIVKHVKYLINNKPSKVYQVRNGKMWCTRDRKDEIDKYVSKLKCVLPDCFIQTPGTRLALPTSEKNFSGPFPIGTTFEPPPSSPLIVGVYWRNQDGKRIDLDLSAVDMNSKVGWNRNYSTQDVVFSGDVIDAPQGANEYLCFKNITSPKIVLVNKYRTCHDGIVNMNIIIGTGAIAKGQNMLDDSQVIATTSTTCDEKQKTIGIVYPTDDGPKFVLIDKCIGKKIAIGTANKDSEIMMNTLMTGHLYIDEYSTVITNPDKDTYRNAIDLSNKTLSKNTILNIFK